MLSSTFWISNGSEYTAILLGEAKSRESARPAKPGFESQLLPARKLGDLGKYLNSLNFSPPVCNGSNMETHHVDDWNILMMHAGQQS